MTISKNKLPKAITKQTPQTITKQTPQTITKQTTHDNYHTSYPRQLQQTTPDNYQTCILLFLLDNPLHLEKPTIELFTLCINVYTRMYLVTENLNLRNYLHNMSNF
jgi:hypothetical protein